MEEVIRLKKATYNLWVYLVSKLILNFGGSIYSFGASFYILKTTGSAASFSVNLICSILPRTLLSPLAGYVADTYNKKTTVIVAQIGSIAALSGLLIFTIFNGVSLTAIFVTTAITSVTSTFSGVTFTSAVANLIDKERIQKAMSFNQLSVSLATIAGPPVGGMLFAAVSFPVFVGIFILAYFVSALLDSTLNFKLYTNQSDSEKKKEKVLESIKEGIRYLRGSELISRIVLISLVINFFFGAVQVGLAFVVVEQLKINSTHFGIIEASTSVGMMITSLYVGMRKSFKEPLFLSKWGIVGMGISMGLLAVPLLVPLSYFGNVSYNVLICFVFGTLMVLVNTPIMVLMQTSIAEEYRGRVFSLLETMAMALMPLAMVIFGILFDFMPSQYIFLTSSILLIIYVLLMFPSSLIKKYTNTEVAQ